MKYALRCLVLGIASMFVISIFTWLIHESTVALVAGRSPKEKEEAQMRWQNFMRKSLTEAIKIKEEYQERRPDFSFRASCGDECKPNCTFATHLSPELLRQRIATLEPDMSHKTFNQSRVLILTPMKNTANIIDNYYTLITSTNYPHNLISVGIGVDPSSKLSFEKLNELPWEAAGFEKVQIIALNSTSFYAYSRAEAHRESLQKERRKHMARARNELLMRALSDHDYVLWVDADVKEWRADTIHHLLDAQRDVIVPACMYVNSKGNYSLYDRNSWQETKESIEHQVRYDAQGKGHLLVLEGYAPTMRLYITDLRSEERIVPLDGVGGCVLMIRASCHREGLNFPTFAYRHHIETEGLAKLAQSMGFGVYGLPYLQVVHT